jgi:hypothetical protein
VNTVQTIDAKCADIIMADTWSYDDPLRAGQSGVDPATARFRTVYDCLDATARRRILQTMAVDKACASLLAQSPQALTQLERSNLELMQLRAHYPSACAFHQTRKVTGATGRNCEACSMCAAY